MMLHLASNGKALSCLVRRCTNLLSVSNSIPYKRAFTRSLASVPISSPTRDTAELDALTTLPNGIRVATEALPGHFSALGVFVDAGSRYETDRLRGISHIMDRLAYKSTKSRSADQMLEMLESLGGNIHCASSREALMFQAGVFNHQVENMLGLLAETVREPILAKEEVSQQLDTAAYEIGEIWAKPELILPELVHTTAYKNNTLGNPLLCPEDRLHVIDRDLILEYREAMFRPERMVIAFAGVGHDTAVKLVERYFGDMKTDPASPMLSKNYPNPAPSRPLSPAGIFSKIPLFKSLSTTASPAASVLSSLAPPSSDTSPLASFNPLTQPSHYTGGLLSLPLSTSTPSIHNPNLTHCHIAFEGLHFSHPDIYALAILQTLLGGGGSFSAGGPGKGMYSRLYTQVLNKCGWVESCIAFNSSYSDSGLFGIAASCAPDSGQALIDIICNQMRQTFATSGPEAIAPQELSRAKNQLRSSLLMNLESRMVELEDLGRQVQIYGRKIGAKEMTSRIEAVTLEDIRRVAETVFTGKVKSVGQGDGRATIVVRASAGECEQRKMEGAEAVVKRWGLGRGAWAKF